jgi:hypothetical protein
MHKPQARIERTSNSERSTLVGELKQMLRDGETKAGVVIDPPLAHEIAKHITILNEELAQPQTAQSMTRIRDSVARFFGKVSGDRKTPKKSAKAAVAALAERPKPAKTEPSRPKKPKTTVTKRSVTNRAVFKPSASKGAKGSKGSKRR